MGNRGVKAFAVSATALSAVAAVGLILDTAGGGKQVGALASAIALGAIPSILGLWLVRKQTLREFRKKTKIDMQQGRAMVRTPRDHDLLNTQVLPSFSDAGVDQTQDFFVDLISSLDLSLEEKEKQMAFINEVAENPDLPREDKIERIVLHFTSEALEREDPGTSPGLASPG
ncbi:MAG TPA: hypothetical protein VFX44_02085 [Solirubrobacterales bacterium]|nr:hypothetical protein [Solirubrobacterales bacterium]